MPGTTDTRKAQIPTGSFIMNYQSSRMYPQLEPLARKYSADKKDMANSQNVILTNGEIYFPPDAVEAIGVEKLEYMNNKSKGGAHDAIDNAMAMSLLKNIKPMYGGGMVEPSMKPMAGGGMMESYRGGGMVMDQYGHGGMVKNKMMNYGHGGMVKDKMMMMEKGGQLKPVPEDNPGLGKLPEMVRNRMGYMQMGGMVDDSLMGMMGGGMAKKKKKMMGYQEGGSVMSKVLRNVGRDLDRGGIEQEGDMFNFKRVLSVPAEQVGGGEGLRYYAGEGMSDSMQMSRNKAYMDAVQKMVSAEKDSIPMAMIDEYLAPKKRSLRDLLPFQEGGAVMLPPQPRDPLQIGARQADPSMYEGSTLGAMRNQAMMLQDSIEQDTVNKARNTLKLMDLINTLQGAGTAELLDSPTGNPVLDREKQMRDIQFREMFGNFPE